jgi:hypothetical protein
MTAMVISCGKKAEEAWVTFETPQPVNKSDIKELPKSFVGKYSPLKRPLSLYDSSTIAYDSNILQIQREIIVETKIFNTTQLLDSADRELYRRDTTFAITEYGGLASIVIKGDSAFYHTISKDTLFSSLRGDVLRKFKGYYFLNQKTPSGKWFVRKLSKFKDGLIVGTISSTADFDKLKLISKSDTVYNFKLTRKQFKEFVNANGFTDEDVFIKIQ